MTSNHRYVLLISIFNIICHFCLVAPLPEEVRSLAGIVIVVFAPGIMLFGVVTERARLTTAWSEYLLLGPGLGYALFVWVMLLLAYIPGELFGPAIVLVFDSIFIILVIVAWRSSSTLRNGPIPWMPRAGENSQKALIALFSVLLVAAFFRLANLGYAEFQGDEAKIIVYGASVVQGYEDTLFIHRKGPVEILHTANTLALLGQINEGAARLPFALGNIIGVGLLFLLAYRLSGLRAAWLGAMLLALDGYYIGSTRMVQYQYAIFLGAAGSLYFLFWLYQLSQEDAEHAISAFKIRTLLYLSGIFFVTGLITHYEGVIVGLPCLFILYLLWRNTKLKRRLTFPMIETLILAAFLTALFYIPFVRHPYFLNTVERYSSDVVGTSQRFYNNIVAFTERGQLYNFHWIFYVTMAAIALHMMLMYGRSSNRAIRWCSGILALLFLIIMFFPERFIRGIVDWTAIIAGLFLLAAVMAPQATVSERILWLWLAPALFLSLFLMSDPSGHFYIFYAPLALLSGLVLATAWAWLVSQMGEMRGNAIAGVGIGLLFALGTIYTYVYYVYHDEEVVRNWGIQQTLPGWMVHASRENNPIFGIPHYSGWKTIGVLFATNQLTGSYATNVRSWISDWYTRNAEYCEDDPDIVFIEIVERPEEKAELLAEMGDRYRQDGVITVDDQPMIEIYRRNGEADETITVYDARTFDAAFDQHLANANLHITVPEINLPITPLSYQFGDDLELTGYQLHEDRVSAGRSLSLILTWRVLNSIEQEYIVFNQILGPEARKVGQIDTAVSCDAGPSYDWDVGDTVQAHYRIPLFAGEPSGTYPLYVGIYDRANHDRVPITDAQGLFIGDALKLTDITLDNSSSNGVFIEME